MHTDANAVLKSFTIPGLGWPVGNNTKRHVKFVLGHSSGKFYVRIS
jgi:hypothetical protein